MLKETAKKQGYSTIPANIAKGLSEQEKEEVMVMVKEDAADIAVMVSIVIVRNILLKESQR